jgi:hypothetical protein
LFSLGGCGADHRNNKDKWKREKMAKQRNGKKQKIKKKTKTGKNEKKKKRKKEKRTGKKRHIDSGWVAAMVFEAELQQRDRSHVARCGGEG